MSFDAHKNFAYSTVATAPSPATSGTSLVVVAGEGAKFPATPFNATVWPTNAQPTTANAEIVRVTNIAIDTLTITRAQESSSARTVVVGDQIAATVTAKTLTDVEAAIPSVPVSSVFSRTGAVVAADGDYEGVVAAALTGATQATRYVGATTSGAPVSGSFVIGDFIVARNGHIFVCTTAGSPGTWTDVGSAGSLVSSVFGRTGGVTATSGDYTAAQVTNAADKSSASQQAFTGEVASPDFAPSGLTGATSASRYVGATASGVPASGTFVVGDFVVARNGHIFVCTTGGSPGTWTDAGSVANLVTSVFGRTGAVAATSGDYNLNQIGNATGDYSINSHKLTNVTDPGSAQDAATKNYVDTTFAAAALTADVHVYGAGTPTWTKPAGAKSVEVVCIGSGGGGGGGFAGTGITACSGGSGGGGGGVSRAVFQASDVPGSLTVTVGAGGSVGGPAANGGDGAATSFGSLLTAGGGGGGRTGASGANSSGAAGGSVIASAVGTTAGSPIGSGSNSIGGQGSQSGGLNATGLPSEWGGASGGGSQAANAIAKSGGNSIMGGPGGAAGGGSGTAGAGTGANGGTGGGTQAYSAAGGGGGTAGTGGGSGSNGGGGGNGTFTGPFCGAAGGGGGGGGATKNGGNGGTGSVGAGGGGGGATQSGTAGSGGVGGDGRCIVITHF